MGSQSISSDVVLERIRHVVYSVARRYGVGVVKIVLFGSRARGDYREDSDWDIMVVVDRRLSRRDKLRLWYDIYRELDIPADILIVDKDTLEKYKRYPGLMYRYALSEGIVI